MKEENQQNQSRKKQKNYMGLKLLIIAGLVVALLIPKLLITNLIDERADRRQEAIVEVGSKWGKEQTIIGPVLSIPYVNKDVTRYVHILPNTLDIQGRIDPELLQRGIYKIIAYNSRLSFDGSFELSNLQTLNSIGQNILWDRASLSFVVSDLRGIQDDIVINWNGNKLNTHAGSIFKTKDVTSGASTPVTVSSLQKQYHFSFDLNLNGIEKLSFLPLGGQTTVKLDSNWQTPSFDGAFLPDSRDISEQGFSAAWKILEINRDIAQSFTTQPEDMTLDSAFGVNLLVPVDEYQKTTRSVKYAILVIGLTFLIFFFVEILNKRKIHPVQYILVGLALVLFYSLLLALSEHVNFNLSYALAGLATILAITIYSKRIFKNFKLTLLQALSLVVIYIFVFIIIQLQDYALLAGNIGLFVILAIIMFVSSKIDWYSADKLEK